MPDDLADIIDDPFVKRAKIGAEAEVFLSSQLGAYLQERSNREIREATLELIDTDPRDAETNIKLREQIHRAGDAIEWLIQAINDAEQARHEIHEQESFD